MIDPALQTSIALALETAIQKALHYDPASLHALKKLQGQTLAIETTTPNTIFYCLFLETESTHTESSDNTENVLEIYTQYEGKVTTRIKGSLMSLAQLAKSDRMNLANSGVEVFGSTGLLIELQTIFKNSEIDWEDALNEKLGDLAGHQTANGIRTVFGWATARKKTLTRLLGEYLTEEVKATPNKIELEKYYSDVSALQLATDRISARVDALKTALKKQ